TVTLDTASVAGGIPEGTAVSLEARVLDALDPATAMLNGLLVDVSAPGAPANVVAQVGSNVGDRRRGRFEITWDASNDGGEAAVASYAIAYSTTAITNPEQFATAYASGGFMLSTPPVAPGGTESTGVSGLTLETVYHFAVRSVDASGNWSDVAQASGSGVGARFNTLGLEHPT